MKVGDLVRIKHKTGSFFFIRPDVEGIGIIIETDLSAFTGIIYYVQTTDGVWRFSDYELELLDGSG